VTGRTADSAWLQVKSDENDRSGWVKGDEVVAFGLDLVPVLDVTVLAEAEPASDTAGKTNEAGTARLTAHVDTGKRNLNLRRGPGTGYGIVGVARNGQELTVVGRNEAGDWLLVMLPDQPDKVAWAAARYLDVDGDPAALSERDQLSTARVVRGASASASAGKTAGLSGKLVFQTSSGGPIMVYDLASGAIRQLTTGMHPAVSSDGSTVAFIRDGGGDSGLYLIGIDGSNEHRIFSANQLRTPSWSPDGSHIVFSRITGQEKCRDVGYGMCLPDSPWLVRFPLKVTDVRGLSRVDVNGGSFADIPSEKQAYAPDWSSGGIVYQSRSGLKITRDGASDADHPLLTDPRYQAPSWRLDGSAIAFVSLEKDHREIFRVNPDGSGLVALTHPGDFIENPRAIQHVAPAWSPDGRFIVYLSDENGDWALYVMNADGSNQRKLPITTPIEYHYQGEQVVDWGR
jgi:TolB protein